MRVAIIGGGFAGVYAMRTLQRYSSADITLFEPRDCFVFTPLLHEVAVDVLHVPNVTHPYEDIFNRRFTHVQEAVRSITPEKKEIETRSGAVHTYDYCIVCIGSRTWMPREMDVLTLKSVEDARAILGALRKSRSCCIVGGGPTGVELAGEIADMCTYEKRKVDVTLVHSRDRLLPGQDRRVQEEAREVLERKGVELLFERKVQDVDGTQVVLDDGTLSADTVIWTAGVVPNQLEGQDGHIRVRRTLQSERHEHVFAAGDNFLIEQDPVPDLAQAAVQQGVHAAKNVLRHARGKRLREFRYRSKGFLVSLGQKTGAGIVKGLFVRGFIAWFIWRTVYLLKFVGVRSKMQLAKEYTVRLFSR